VISWVVYLVQGQDGSVYTGITTDVIRRLDQHNGLITGGAKYTRRARPWRLIYVEHVPSVESALKRENAIKAMPRAEKLRLSAW
jgi:putative endonuclease